MPSQRRYTDDEVHAIFERAAVRQEEAQSAEHASRPGLSLEELQEIGADAGIDPAHVALAASELTVSGHTMSKPVDDAFLGIPTRIEASRRIHAHFGDEEWERIVHEMRGIFGRAGIAGELGKVREWTVTSSVGKFDRPVKLTLTPDGDDSLVTIDQEMKGQAVGFSIGSGVYVAIAVVMMLINFITAGDGPPLGVSLLFFGMAALFFGGAQVGTRIHASRQRTRFDRALDRIELLAGQSSFEMDRQVVGTSPQIDLDALPDVQDSEADEVSQRNRELE